MGGNVWIDRDEMCCCQQPGRKLGHCVNVDRGYTCRPWYVISLLGRDDIFKSFVSDVFKGYPRFSEAETLEVLIQECYAAGLDKKWESHIPKQGSSKVLQAETSAHSLAIWAYASITVLHTSLITMTRCS